VVRRCTAEGLIGGSGFAVDASLIKADSNRQRGVEGAKGLPPEAASRAIDEYIAVLDNAAFGAATEVTPKFLSLADPAARWTGAHGGLAFFAYLDDSIVASAHNTSGIRPNPLVVQSRSEMGWIIPEAIWLVCPCLADHFVGRQAA